MKTIIASLIALTIATPALAQCLKQDDFFKAAEERFGEVPLWTGKSDGGLTVTMVFNADTETWGIVTGDGKNVCVIVTGKGLGPVVVGDPA